MASEEKIWSQLCDTCTERFRCLFDISHPVFNLLAQPYEKWSTIETDKESGNVPLQSFPSSTLEIKYGVAAGCGLCSELSKRLGNKDCISSQRWLVGCRKSRDTDTSSESKLPDIEHFQVQIFTNEPGARSTCQVAFDVRASVDDPAGDFISRKEFTDSFETTDCKITIQRWMEQCTRHHQHCQRPSKLPMPTRVLDIDLEDTTSVKLLHTEGRTEPYAALSYCWGDGPNEETTKENLQKKLQPFALESLPKTIQDAVLSAKQLGLRFLWIDALCIIQDCKEDKLRELAKMHGVYKNSHATLIAARAHSVHDGFLKHQERPKVDLTIPYGESEGKCGTMLLREEVQLKNRLRGSPDATERRGWCLQEGLLSHRCIVYSQYSLLWKCKTVQCAENVPGSYFDNDQQLEIFLWIWRHVPLRMLDVSLDQISGQNVSQSLSKAWEFWFLTIELFTPRKLSEPMDKLFAVQGIATELHSITGSRYLAGLSYKTNEIRNGMGIEKDILYS